MGSSRTRARTHVPCIGRQILNHCATREIPLLGSFLSLYRVLDPTSDLLRVGQRRQILASGACQGRCSVGGTVCEWRMRIEHLCDSVENSSDNCGVQVGWGRTWGQVGGDKPEKLVGFKDWSPGRCRRRGEWEGQGELGGWEAVVREQNVSFSAVELLQVMRLLRYQTQTPSGAGR